MGLLIQSKHHLSECCSLPFWGETETVVLDAYHMAMSPEGQDVLFRRIIIVLIIQPVGRQINLLCLEGKILCAAPSGRHP